MRGDGRIFLRGRVWWIAYSVNGRERRESSRSGNQEAAERLLDKRLREKTAAEVTGQPFAGQEQKRILVGQLLDALLKDLELRGLRYLKKRLYHLRPVREYFGDRRAIAVTSEAVDRYIEQRLRQGRAMATINRETQLLGQAFRLAQERHLLSVIPRIRYLSEKDNARQGFFEHADFQAVIEHLPDYLQDFARFAYLTGWRKGEIASLRWADVDRSGRIIHLRPEASKNRAGRSIALEGELWKIIERRWHARVIDADRGEACLAASVFHVNGQRIGDFRKAWHSACKHAGLHGKLFHDLRRTAIRNMVRAGVPERVAMQISGHKTRSVFDRYNIVSERDLREAVEKTQAYLEAAPRERTVLVFERHGQG